MSLLQTSKEVDFFSEATYIASFWAAEVLAIENRSNVINPSSYINATFGVTCGIFNMMYDIAVAPQNAEEIKNAFLEDVCKTPTVKGCYNTLTSRKGTLKIFLMGSGWYELFRLLDVSSFKGILTLKELMSTIFSHHGLVMGSKLQRAVTEKSIDSHHRGNFSKAEARAQIHYVERHISEDQLEAVAMTIDTIERVWLDELIASDDENSIQPTWRIPSMFLVHYLSYWFPVSTVDYRPTREEALRSITAWMEEFYDRAVETDSAYIMDTWMNAFKYETLSRT